MRILFVVPYTPNLIRVRPYNLIRYLSRRGHQITLFTLGDGTRAEADAAALSEYCHQIIQLPISQWRSAWNCLTILPTGKPLQSAYSWQPELAKQISQTIHEKTGGKIDVVHVEHLRGVRYGLEVNRLKTSNGGLPVVWDSVDCISLLFRQASAKSKSLLGRWSTAFELSRTERYESWLLSQFSQILVTSAIDKEAFLALNGHHKRSVNISVLPNGVDLDYFQPQQNTAREEATLVITGKMSYHANVTMVLEFVQTVMPGVWSQLDNVKLQIVGKDPPASLQKLASHPLITVTGEVPDMRPYLQSAAISVAPVTYGAGIQNKILEAMACGTPVVTSEQAANSLLAVPGKDLLVANESNAFGEAILDLLSNPSRRSELGANGREFVESHHQWDEITGQLEQIYERAINFIN